MIHILLRSSITTISQWCRVVYRYDISLVIIFIIIIFTQTCFSHDNGVDPTLLGFITGNPVHQAITRDAGEIWPDLPVEIRSHLQVSVYSSIHRICNAYYEPGYDIISGSGDEDQEWFLGICPPFIAPGPTYNNGFFEHFWDPDEPNFNGISAYDKGFSEPNIFNGHVFASSYNKAQELWNKRVICYYTGRDNKGNTCPIDKGQAYYWLGRVIHLLEDLTVPAHVHNVPHDPLLANRILGGKDLFEDHVGAVLHAYGRLYLPEYFGQLREYKHEDLPGIALQQGFQWTNLHLNPTPLFKLFWYTAQKTQYYANGGGPSLQRQGDKGAHRKLDGTAIQFQPSLWEGIQPIDIPTDIPDRLPEIAGALIPHALRAVAGLYRLFWLETNPAQQAQQDMINRAKLDQRFGAAIPGTFNEQLDWVTNVWDLRWMNFNFTGHDPNPIWHVTYKLDPGYRYTIFWDPDANNWAPWVQAQ